MSSGFFKAPPRTNEDTIQLILQADLVSAWFFFLLLWLCLKISTVLIFLPKWHNRILFQPLLQTRSWALVFHYNSCASSSHQKPCWKSGSPCVCVVTKDKKRKKNLGTPYRLFINILCVSVVGGCQSRSLWHPQPAGLLWVWKPEGHATGQAALPLATAKHSVTSFPRGVHLRGDHCEYAKTVLCFSE